MKSTNPLIGVVLGLFAVAFIHENLVFLGVIEPGLEEPAPVIFLGGWILIGFVVYKSLRRMLG